MHSKMLNTCFFVSNFLCIFRFCAVFFLFECIHLDGYSLWKQRKILYHRAILNWSALWYRLSQSHPYIHWSIYMEGRYVRTGSYQSANDSFSLVPSPLPEIQKEKTVEKRYRNQDEGEWYDFFSGTEENVWSVSLPRSFIHSLRLFCYFYFEWC